MGRWRWRWPGPWVLVLGTALQTKPRWSDGDGEKSDDGADGDVQLRKSKAWKSLDSNPCDGQLAGSELRGPMGDAARRRCILGRGPALLQLIG
ncbi:hypothetical protein DFH27DRAFT_59600 [Peziza echinospora]|nr:hypothetical protein DFH27DRAFT_59600 [Peziza echinospora]